MKLLRRLRFRSARTGQFTTARHAADSPNATVSERVGPYISTDAPIRAALDALARHNYHVGRNVAADVAEAVLQAAGVKR